MIIADCGRVFVVSFFAALMFVSPSIVSAHTDEVRCSPKGVDLNDLRPLRLTEAQRTDLTMSYKAPEVRGLRLAIDAALAHESRSAAATKFFVDMPAQTLRNRFVLMSDNKGLFGGYFLTILFENHFDRIYQAWVYPVAAGSYELRGWSQGTCSPAEQRWTKARYGQLIHSLGG